MPSVTTQQRNAVNLDPMRDPHLILLEFQEDGQYAIERVAINTEDVVFQGNTYVRGYIEVTLPQTGDEEQKATLSASNVERILSRALDGARRVIGCRMIMINANIPDVAIIDTKNLFMITKASGDSNTVSVDLAPRLDLDDPVPNKKTTKADFPGVFL